MVIDTFLYSDLRYTINMGKNPLLVDGVKVDNYTTVPYVEWEINFGLIDHEFKNYLEELLVEEESFDLVTQIHPSMKLVYDQTGDRLSYKYPHEAKFYGENTFDINRRLSHSLLGNNLVYENNTFDITTSSILSSGLRIPHRVHYLDGTLKLDHKFNNFFELSAKFKEYFQPTVLVNQQIGASSASNFRDC